MKKNVLIVGYGIVGKNLAKELAVLKPDIYDKYNPDDNSNRDIVYDVAFLCVDTPMNENCICDVTEVFDAVIHTKADVFVIKSTVLPGTTNDLKDMSGKEIIFSPEYYGTTQHNNNFNFDFTVLGGSVDACDKVAQLLQTVYDARHKFYIVDSTTAELAKYMENSYLATKVSFCVQFYQICQEIGVNYNQLRELFIADPRVNPSHTFVYQDKPFWDSHCLNKDVYAVATKYNAEFLKNVMNFNSWCISNNYLTQHYENN